MSEVPSSSAQDPKPSLEKWLEARSAAWHLVQMLRNLSSPFQWRESPRDAGFLWRLLSFLWRHLHPLKAAVCHPGDPAPSDEALHKASNLFCSAFCGSGAPAHASRNSPGRTLHVFYFTLDDGPVFSSWISCVIALLRACDLVEDQTPAAEEKQPILISS